MPSGFFAILDDIGALMDDVAVASKIATRKTAGILGDDLAVNAEKATGFLASRELPVLWAITKGSLLNKIIIIPVVMLLQVFFPAAIKIILFIGGFYLAYEGAHKIWHYLFHRSKQEHSVLKQETEQDAATAEKEKIKSAITTDFILSVEIVIITLGSVLESPLGVQIATVSVVALLATAGVYGIVALIVRMDDAGRKLIERANNGKFLTALGNFLVKALPVVIKVLSVVGTIALLLVAGGIFVHNINWLHHHFTQIPATLKELLVGLVAGIVALPVFEGGKKLVTAIKGK